MIFVYQLFHNYIHRFSLFLLQYQIQGVIIISRDAPILLFFPPIFLPGNSFFSDLFCSIFCSKVSDFAYIFPNSKS